MALPAEKITLDSGKTITVSPSDFGDHRLLVLINDVRYLYVDFGEISDGALNELRDSLMEMAGAVQRIQQARKETD